MRSGAAAVVAVMLSVAHFVHSSSALCLFVTEPRSYFVAGAVKETSVVVSVSIAVPVAGAAAASVIG